MKDKIGAISVVSGRREIVAIFHRGYYECGKYYASDCSRPRKITEASLQRLQSKIWGSNKMLRASSQPFLKHGEIRISLHRINEDKLKKGESND